MLLYDEACENPTDLFYVHSLQQKGAETGDGSLYVTYRNQVILSTMGIPGSLLAGWMVEQPIFGRKGTLAISTGTSSNFIFALLTMY